MPELPEVQTTVNGLRKEVLKRTFLDFWTDTPKIVKNVDANDFRNVIKNEKIIEVRRRAKNILLYLSNSQVILIHLKMTGHLLVGNWAYSESEKGWVSLVEGPIKDDPYNRFIRVIFFLDDGRQLALCDMRKFAKIELWKDEDIETVFADVGPEPLEDDFRSEDFIDLFRQKKGKIKQLLMDQSIIAGIGNIYASEILFEAGVHPEETVPRLTEEDFRRMFMVMKDILKRAIGAGGDSFSDFRNIYGERGDFQNIMKVYGKDGHNCTYCDNMIVKTIIGGRGTFHCPNCQKLKK
ncbi:MAG: DNA-formamidopyrimidine glycosylase [Candidatus Pacebacteria bacterium]|nr:DNA-formamidopyrimidine glycosylase [Candidatus Paceibacterota bacterium]